MQSQSYFSAMIFFLAAITFLLAYLAQTTVSNVVTGWAADVATGLLFAGVVGMIAGVIGVLLSAGGKRLE